MALGEIERRMWADACELLVRAERLHRQFNVIGRVFGIVLAGLAIQYIVDGLAASFPILMKH
jgi:small neutral amino acid transporter SnatA (MarC family)